MHSIQREHKGSPIHQIPHLNKERLVLMGLVSLDAYDVLCLGLKGVLYSMSTRAVLLIKPGT